MEPRTVEDFPMLCANVSFAVESVAIVGSPGMRDSIPLLNPFRFAWTVATLPWKPFAVARNPSNMP